MEPVSSGATMVPGERSSKGASSSLSSSSAVGASLEKTAFRNPCPARSEALVAAARVCGPMALVTASSVWVARPGIRSSRSAPAVPAKWGTLYG